MLSDPYSRREVFHLLFLERLLKASDPALFALKGGVNLRFYFKSPRYSEDMDLDALGGAVATLRKNVYKILEDPSFRRALSTYGLVDLKVSDPAKAKQTETTQRFKLKLVNTAGEEFPTKVEFSRRRGSAAGTELETVDPEVARRYQRLSFSCRHYTGATAILQKVEALVGRAQHQSRDVFDLCILLRGGYMDKYARAALEQGVLVRKAKERIASFDYADYEGQVVEYLESSAKKEFSGKVRWEALKQELMKALP